MNKKYLLFCGAIALLAGSARAQKLADGYITWPNSESLHEYVNAWNGGSGTITVGGATWNDEEFFTSRVKPRTRFTNRNTQVYSTITDDNDKRYCNWVPLGNCLDGEFHTNGLPNAVMDSEVFSMWSYVDHYGNWTSPYGWVPAAFADAAHKNGVAVSGVASVPFGSISTGWSSEFSSITSLSADAVGKFLYYHGSDGLGYNSEWSGGPVSALTTMHNNLATYMSTRNPLWEVMWYAGTSDSGSLAFDSGISSFTGLFKSASMFLNYNWNNTSTMTTAIAKAKSMNRSPFLIYAGMNQQGGEPKSGENYPILKNYQYSIGIWGAHQVNMLWQGRNAKGSSPETMQRTYLNDIEMWYTGGKRNPAIRQTIQTNRAHRPSTSWAGISSMMSARSTINHTIANEPFYTFFNLGNGKFFNWRGDRVSDNEWYSLGVQDFLPTWRWWFAPALMDGDVSESEVHLAADFVWDDAYVGGSCLQIAGTTADEYLHLFKTSLVVANGNEITVRFKVLEGSADVDLLICNGNQPSTVQKTISLMTKDQCDALADASYKAGAQGWQEVKSTISNTEYRNLRAANGNLGLIALRFRNADNLKIYLGELSIAKSAGNQTTTPAAPVIKKSMIVNNTYSGVDGKIIWSMANSKAVGEPVYNSDVNASMFKVYAREEGDAEPTFLGATTSWAAIGFRAPNTSTSKKIQYGVSAVSMDAKTESAISWGDLLSKGSYTPSNDIYLSKTTIKPNESFEIGYTDKLHSSSSWTLVDANGNTVGTGSGTSFEMPSGLPDVGGYDLYVDKGTTNERHFGFFVQISGEGVGALPEIYTASIDGDSFDEGSSPISIELTDTPTLAYTGRHADGSASRALSLNSRMIGCKVGELGIGSTQSVSIAGWFKFDDFPQDSWAFMNISNLGGPWPNCNWGWCWNEVDIDGYVKCTFRGNSSDSGTPGELHYTFSDTKLQANIWTHIAFVCEYGTNVKNGSYSGTGFRLHLYINGVEQKSTWFQYTKGNSGSKKYTNQTQDAWCVGQTNAIESTDYVYFGGPLYQHSAVEGLVDDFQVWDKAMTADDVRTSMSGLDPNNLPANVVALWDFEDEAASDYSFAAKGSKAGAKGYSHEWKKVGETDANATCIYYEPVFLPGCPFLAGTAYPVVTTAQWKDSSDRKTAFAKASSRAATEGEAGSAVVTFANDGDHNISLSLVNNYGSDTRQFPVFSVKPLSGINDVDADNGDANIYTIDKVLFVEFGADGLYGVDVYNAAGMQVAGKKFRAVAGQNARITLGEAGVYVVRVTRDGNVVRTLKVMSK